MRQRLPPAERFPAREPGLRARTISLRSGLHARVVEPAASAGPPVLLLHGWGASAYSFRCQLPALVQAGFHPIALELKGHGGSDKPASAGEYTLAAMTGFVADAMDALELSHVPLVGHSIGGRIAAAVATTVPDRVSRLALIASVGMGRVRAGRFFRHALAPLPPSVLAPLARRSTFSLLIHIAYGEIGSPSSRDIDEYWAPSDAPGFIDALRGLLRGVDLGPLDAAALERLTVPILVIAGSRDRVIRAGRRSPELAAFLADRLAIIAGGGHMCNEEVPEEVNRALVAFLRGGPVPAS